MSSLERCNTFFPSDILCVVDHSRSLQVLAWASYYSFLVHNHFNFWNLLLLPASTVQHEVFLRLPADLFPENVLQRGDGVELT